jgi:adenine/guanine phosphoribosyltransferase-like PRPP-binding protein
VATAAELLLPLRPGLMPVPAAGQVGVCRYCHSACDPDYEQCFGCLEAVRSVGAVEILPISMSVDGDLIHRHLRGYKDDRSADVRGRMSLRLAALVSVFMEHHRDCVGEFDSVVRVPSPGRIAGEAVVRRVRALVGEYRPALRATGAGSKAELRTDRFDVLRDVDGERVLVIDDTFTRGPTLFSAVGALRDAGAVVAGPLVLGRHVQPGWGPSRELLAWLRGRRWDEGRCCRCAGERADAGGML